MAIEHISDTARWVAYYRHMESERPDAIFRDPFARQLAGERGAEIVRAMKHGRSMAWPMIVRTAVFDEILRDQVDHHGIERVVNLAAGLDARPWRLTLPRTLEWLDVDLPDILQYKLDSLKGVPTACTYQAVPTDLTDAAARRTLFEQLSASARRTLVLTEGLLIYLTPDQVGTLAKDLHAQSCIQAWVIDLASPRLLKLMGNTWGKAVAKGNAPFQFGPAEGTDFFTPFGWRESQFRSSLEESWRLNRKMRGAWFWRAIGMLYPRRVQEEFRRMSGIVLLVRA